MQNQQLYRLIKPYQSNKVYKSHSIMKGAGKCYKEFKNSGYDAKSFSIMNIDTNHVYDFNVNSKPSAITINKDLRDLNKQSSNIILGGNNNIDTIDTKLNNLIKRVEKLENKLNTNLI
jgi:uncharacterized protein (UPF0335 family)